MIEDEPGGIAARLLCPGFTDLQIELALTGFAALWEGVAARPAELLPHRATDVEPAAEVLAEHGRAELDEAGRLVGIHGLTLRPTRHRFVHQGRHHHTWCAFDAIGIPAAMRVDAIAHTDCPACRATLRIDIGKGVPVDHGEALWLPAPPDTQLMTEFCANANLYCNGDHLRQHVDVESVPGAVVALPEVVAIGRDTWADIAVGAVREATS